MANVSRASPRLPRCTVVWRAVVSVAGFPGHQHQALRKDAEARAISSPWSAARERRPALLCTAVRLGRGPVASRPRITNGSGRFSVGHHCLNQHPRSASARRAVPKPLVLPVQSATSGPIRPAPLAVSLTVGGSADVRARALVPSDFPQLDSDRAFLAYLPVILFLCYFL